MADDVVKPRQVLIDADLVHETIGFISHMKAYIDGVVTGGGQHAVAPEGFYEDIDGLRSDLHATVCEHCANVPAPRPKHKPTGETVIKPAIFNGHPPKDGGAA